MEFGQELVHLLFTPFEPHSKTFQGQLVFRSKVLIERHLGDTGPLRDLVDRYIRVGMARKEIRSGGGDPCSGCNSAFPHEIILTSKYNCCQPKDEEAHGMGFRRWIRMGLEWGIMLVFVALIVHRFLPTKAAVPSAGNAVAFTLRGLDGAPIAPDAYKGTAVLLNFWAPWCPPCRMEIPWLQKLQDQNRGKLVVVGVVADPDQYAHAAAMMRREGITYLLVQDSPSLERAFGDPSALPASFYISPSSHVVHTVTGVVPEYTMRRYVADAIGQR